MISPILGDAFGQERVMRDSTELLRAVGHNVFWLGDKKVGDLPALDGFHLFPGISSQPREDSVTEALHVLSDLKPDVVHFIDQFDSKFMRSVIKKYPSVLTAHTVAPTCPASHRLIQKHHICTVKSGWTCLLHQKTYGCLDHFKTDLHRAHAVFEYKKRRSVLKNISAIIAISKYIEETLLRDGWPRDKVKLIYNPVHILEAKKLSDAPAPLLICAARLVELKGIEYLLRALHRLQDLHWTCWILGDGPLREQLVIQSKKLGLEARVLFKGKLDRTQTARAMVSSTLVLQPNIGPEGFGLTVSEAQSFGIPVVAFDMPALNEIIEHQKTGLLCKTADPESLANAIRELLENSQQRLEYGISAKMRMQESFSEKRHLQATLELYREVTETRGANRSDSKILSASFE